jgi:flavin-binding protein dodecin
MVAPTHFLCTVRARGEAVGVRHGAAVAGEQCEDPLDRIGHAAPRRLEQHGAQAAVVHVEHRQQQILLARKEMVQADAVDPQLTMPGMAASGGAAARRVAITRGRQHHGCTRTTNRRSARAGPEGEKSMPDSVYKIIELVGTSTESWEKAAGAAVTQASKSLRDLRIVEVLQLDMQVQNGKVKAYRAKVKVSFKFEGKK